ncbi:hypothetical protein NEAUS03_0439 [Nematocida ausubeli]|nr:hypothetical protein NEAUS03_0439 [Nematocida ausubeli]
MCGKITTPSEISYINRGFKNKKIAIAESSLSQNQKPTIKTDAILEGRSKSESKKYMTEKVTRTSKQNQKQLPQRHTQDMNKSSSLNKMLSILGYYFQAMTLPPLWHVKYINK